MESKCGRASQNFACLFESGILDSFRPYVGAQIKAEMILLEQGAGHGDGTPPRGLLPSNSDISLSPSA